MQIGEDSILKFTIKPKLIIVKTPLAVAILAARVILSHIANSFIIYHIIPHKASFTIVIIPCIS